MLRPASRPHRVHDLPRDPRAGAAALEQFGRAMLVIATPGCARFVVMPHPSAMLRRPSSRANRLRAGFDEPYAWNTE